MNLGFGLLRILSIFKPKNEYSFHLGPNGLKINCDNEIFFECTVSSGECINYNYSTMQKIFQISYILRESGILQDSMVTIGPINIYTEPSDLPEITSPPTNDKDWIVVPRNYLYSIMCYENTITLRICPQGFIVTNGIMQMKIPISGILKNSTITITPNISKIISNYLEILESQWVSVLVSEINAFGIRPVMGGYIYGPIGTLWVPHE